MYSAIWLCRVSGATAAQCFKTWTEKVLGKLERLCQSEILKFAIYGKCNMASNTVAEGVRSIAWFHLDIISEAQRSEK